MIKHIGLSTGTRIIQTDSLNAEQTIEKNPISQSEVLETQNLPKIKPSNTSITAEYQMSAVAMQAQLQNQLQRNDSDAKTIYQALSENPTLAEADIMALDFIVSMEGSKSAREDLKSLMEQKKDINTAKQKMISYMSQLKSSSDSDDSDDS